MPKLIKRVPGYCKHKATGQAYVRLDGRDFYLGKWNSAASVAEYNRITSEWLAAGRKIKTNPLTTTIGEIVLQYVNHADGYYRDTAGQPTGAIDRIIRELKPLVSLYKDTPAAEFGPLRLKAVRQNLIEAGWVRKSINHAVFTIRACFSWAVSNELIPAEKMKGLREVKSLKAGKSKAKESAKVRGVKDAVIDATLPFMPPMIAMAVQLQRLTGMRSGKLLAMRTADIDRSSADWVYTPRRHKTLHLDHERPIFLGPKCQDLLLPLLKLDGEAFIFSPAESERQRREQMHAERVTPLSCGNVPGSNRKRGRSRKPGAFYTVRAYRRAVCRASDAADAWEKGGRIVGDDERLVPAWHPHQIRHSFATKVRKQHGLEASQILLGHSTLAATQFYAEKDAEMGKQIMRLIG